MVGARKHREHLPFSPHDSPPEAAKDAGGSAAGATLTEGPEGLSARRVENWLGLPPGAWQRRRLYALRVKVGVFGALGIRSGDLVVVDPGAKEQAGSIVVTRGPHGASLRRVPSLAATEPRMPTVLELPLRERTTESPAHVVGTVIGLLRATGTGALRPVPMFLQKERRRRVPIRTAELEPAVRTDASVPPELLDRSRRKWNEWLRATCASGRLAPADVERCERLDASFATLCDCLARTHNPELRGALAEEARSLLEKIREEMSRRDRGYRNYPFSQ
jgi:hypothetical protein